MLPDNGKRVKQQLNYHMRLQEVLEIFEYVRVHCALKWEIALLLMITRGFRPAECMALHTLDFSVDFTRVTYREAKTNKLRINEAIVPEVAARIQAYCRMNTLKEGYLFHFYNKKSQGRPYMTAQVFSTWFCDIRSEIARNNPRFNEKYPFSTKSGGTQWRHRINLYSFRRFFETYLYCNNKFNLALIKQICEYSSKFDPMKHYITFFHEEGEKDRVLQETFSPLVSKMIHGQKQLSEFLSCIIGIVILEAI